MLERDYDAAIELLEKDRREILETLKKNPSQELLTRLDRIEDGLIKLKRKKAAGIGVPTAQQNKKTFNTSILPLQEVEAQ
jgi:Mg2+ and Co2+ transporter CorA